MKKPLSNGGAEHMRATFHEPNETTKAVIAEVMSTRNKQVYDNVDELIENL